MKPVFRDRESIPTILDIVGRPGVEAALEAEIEARYRRPDRPFPEATKWMAIGSRSTA